MRIEARFIAEGAEIRLSPNAVVTDEKGRTIGRVTSIDVQGDEVLFDAVLEDPDMADWLQFGRDKGFIVREFCGAHDMGLTPEEMALDDDDIHDRCLPAVRLAEQ